MSTLLLFLQFFIPVDVIPSAGESIRGDLQSIDATNIVINSGDGPVSIPLEGVARLDWPEAQSRSPSEKSLLLRNESLIPTPQLTSNGNQLTIQPRRQPPLSVDISAVHAVRFHLPRSGVDSAWLGMVAEESASDRLVIRRDENTLDTAEGVIVSIDDSVVEFEIDGDSVSAPLERLEGVIYGAIPVSSQASDSSRYVVNDSYGGRWLMESLSANSTTATFKIAGQSHSIELENLLSITLSGSSELLANAETVSSQWNLDIAPEVERSLTDAFLVRRHSGNIEFPAGTEVTYRVPQGFSRLVGSAGRASDVVAATKVAITLSEDQRELWSGAIEGDQRVGFDLDVSKSRRITIKIDSAGDGSLGDTVELSQVRFLK